MRSLRINPDSVLLKRVSKLHRYPSSEATTDNEHAVRRRAMRTEPVPRGPCVGGEPRFARLARRVCKAAIVRREHVSTQPCCKRLIVLHANPPHPCARRPVQEEDGRVRAKCSSDIVIS